MAADLPKRRFALLGLGTCFYEPRQSRKSIGGTARGAAQRAKSWGHDFYLGVAYMTLNRLDEAEAVYSKAGGGAQTGERVAAPAGLRVGFSEGRCAADGESAGAAVGKLGVEDLLLATQADTEAWYGKLKNARELTRWAMQSALHNDARETAGIYLGAAALREVESGNAKQARADAAADVKLAAKADWTLAAVALARAGDTAGAEKLAAELGKSFPLNTTVQRYWLPLLIRAAVALHRKDPNRAIQLLKVTSRLELAASTRSSLYP